MEGILQNILINTYNPDKDLRTQAEDALKNFIFAKGAIFVLLSLVGDQSIHRDLRQAGVISIKNKITELYAGNEAFYSAERKIPLIDLTVDEKANVKTGLLTVLLNENDNSIKGLLAECIKAVAEIDFPERWPELVPTLLAQIDNPDVLRVYNSLLALRKLVKRYEYKAKEQRGPLDDIVQVSFPMLQRLMVQLLENNSLEAANVMRVSLKIFWSATIYNLPKAQGVDVSAWFQIIGRILQKELPESSEGLEPRGQPLSLEDRKVWPWWKLKKWAARLASHFIQRYGNPRYAGSEYEAFANYFKSNIASSLLGPIMNTLALKSRGRFVTDDVHRLSLAYMASCVEMSVTYKELKPHLDFIIFAVIFPTLCLTAADIALFSSDPVDFVRKIHDPSEDWLDPRIAAVNLLQMLARYRQKDTLPLLIPFILDSLTVFASSPPESRDYQKKDGVLVAIATIFKILNESKAYKSILEPIVLDHIIPELQSPVAYLRSRACWVIEYVSEMSFSNPTTLQAILKGLLTGLRDPALPVQAAAACSMRTLISLEGAADLLQAYLPEIVSEYFRIMDEVENDAVLSALQCIVEQFGEGIADLAPSMVSNLLRAFQTYANNDDDDEGAFSACQCLDTIGSVLDAVQERGDIMAQLEVIVIPMMMKIMADENFEYLDNVIQMMSYFTYYSEGVSATVWTLCGPFLKSMTTWTYDYTSEIMVCILNYISKDVSTFLSGSFENVPYVTMLLSLVEKAFGEDTGEQEREAKAAATMLTCLLSCSKGNNTQLTVVLPTVLTLVLARLPQCRTLALRVKVLENAMSCIYYDPLATIAVLHTNPDAATTLFTTLFGTFPSMENDSTQRLIVLSLSSLLSLPTHTLPHAAKENVHNMFQQIVRELVFIEEQKVKDDNGEGEDDDDDEGDDDDDMKDREGEEENDDLESDEDEEEKGSGKTFSKLDVPEGGYGEEEDCINAEDEEYRAVLERMEKDGVKHTKYIDGEPVDDEEDDNEDYIFTSPLDSMDVSSFFLSTMAEATLRDPGLVNSLQQGLSNEDKLRLKSIVEVVEVRRASAVTA